MKTLARHLLPAAFASLAILAAFGAHAGEAEIRKNLKERIPQFPAIEEITKTPMPGLYEVRVNGAQIYYTDEQGNYLLEGNMIDVNARRNLTEERVAKLSEVAFDKLPVKDAIKIVRGNGKRKLAVFEDPNCGYCKKMRMDLVAMKDITIYTFPIPILAADSEVKSRKALCADDKVKAWNDMMISGKVPSNPGTCDNALGKLRELAQKLGVSATPTAFFQNGKRLQGYVPGPQFDKMLDENTKS